MPEPTAVVLTNRPVIFHIIPDFEAVPFPCRIMDFILCVNINSDYSIVQMWRMGRMRQMW